VISKLNEKAKLILDDELAPYKMGQYALEKTDLGLKGLIVKVLGSHPLALNRLMRGRF